MKNKENSKRNKFSRAAAQNSNFENIHWWHKYDQTENIRWMLDQEFPYDISVTNYLDEDIKVEIRGLIAAHEAGTLE